MGLIRAALSAVSSTMKDQWKEYFVCDALPNDVLAVRGERVGKGLFGNNKGGDNIISNGSGIVVADGQCMIIVDQGKVAEVCCEPGEFTYDASSEPSIFTGDLGENLAAIFKTIGKRFEYGGEISKDQRVYYFNTKEIIDNKFGTPNPIPFNVVDSKHNIDVDVAIRCAGTYSFRIFDPITFYTNVCGNITEPYTKARLAEQMKSEFISALNPAIGALSKLELRPSEIVNHNLELEDGLNAQLSNRWGTLRGITVVNVAISTITLPEEDAEKIKNIQFYSNAGNAAAAIASATAQAMVDAANNPNGAANAFVGVNMAAGGQNIAAGLYQQAAATAPVQQAAPANSWTCSCGTVNTGKFCSECGKQNPANAPWTCSCGAVNTGKFCSECGKPKC